MSSFAVRESRTLDFSAGKIVRFLTLSASCLVEQIIVLGADQAFRVFRQLFFVFRFRVHKYPTVSTPYVWKIKKCYIATKEKNEVPLSRAVTGREKCRKHVGKCRKSSEKCYFCGLNILTPEYDTYRLV